MFMLLDDSRHSRTRSEKDFQAFTETLYRPAWVIALASEALRSAVPELDAMIVIGDLKKMVG
jgi:hypothetical protein